MFQGRRGDTCIYLVHEHLEQEVQNLISVYVSNVICSLSFALCNLANTNKLQNHSLSPIFTLLFPTSVTSLMLLPW